MAVSEKRNEWVVGLFLFIGLAMLGGLILQFGRFENYFGHQYTITIVFDDASGLIKGSEVRMGGARIGRVAKLPELTESVQVEVELAIDENIRIPAGSSFEINSATLLGDKLIVVVPPGKMTGVFIEPGARLPGAALSGLEALQSQAGTVSRDVIRILGKVEATVGKVDVAVEDIQAASRQLSEAIRKVNQSVLDDNNLAHFDHTMANLSDVSTQWKEASGKLEPTLAEAREAIGDIKSAAGNLTKTLANADKAIASVKPALEGVPKAVDHISDTAEKAGDALDRMKRGEGMLGAFASDNDVAFDFKAFMRNLRRHGIILYKNDDPGEGETESKRGGQRPSPVRHGSKL